jgi:primosomal protein N' (replication factor Y)
MTSDLISTQEHAAESVRAIEAGDVDVIIGTQMIAKGWHFPNLTLVGVVDADLGLSGGDLRAAERSSQLLHQVSGRAGRAVRAGSALLQTYYPEHPVIEALVSGDLKKFRAAEAALRRPGGWPPFGRLAALIISAKDPDVVAQAARNMAQQAPNSPDLDVLGPAPAPISLLRGQHRWRFLLRAGRKLAIQHVIRDWLNQVPLPLAVYVTIDIDPISFL